VLLFIVDVVVLVMVTIWPSFTRCTRDALYDRDYDGFILWHH